ncbi:phosphatase PAP2 family protein [Streptomyces sp. XY332]|uniref:phosphatase PAP2 family protein n=1 Tax=Streptomyces sp. XY332 TaxID=1415561 RepID=UPI0006B18FD6|nr:phosphatase PAP2 family protein [Streptomyces sp. XY332]
MTFSPPAPPAFADCTPRQKAARVVSDGLAPANMVVALLRFLGAPGEVFALVVAMLVGLVSSLLVTIGWQISIHMSVAGGAAMILLLVFGPRVLPAALIAAAVAWSRLVLRAHTPAQLLAGTALGGASALTFLLLS